jgi:ATP-binding cassette subfamily B protein
MFMQTLIDDYITPLTKAVKAGGQADFSGLAKAIGTIMIYYGCGILASFIQSRLMIYLPGHHVPLPQAICSPTWSPCP